MGYLATLNGPRSSSLQAALYNMRGQRLGRIATKPVCTAAPVITGTAQEGETLTCSNGTWTGTPLGYRYVWRRGSSIAGANAATYVLAEADVGLIITCTVTALKGGASAGATSAATDAVIAA